MNIQDIRYHATILMTKGSCPPTYTPPPPSPPNTQQSPYKHPPTPILFLKNPPPPPPTPSLPLSPPLLTPPPATPPQKPSLRRSLKSLRDLLLPTQAILTARTSSAMINHQSHNRPPPPKRKEKDNPTFPKISAWTLKSLPPCNRPVRMTIWSPMTVWWW